MTIVLATCAALPELDLDDQQLAHALKAADVPFEIQVWDDPAVDWGKYAMCVIRSTWDYVPKRDQYVAWAETVASQTALWNPAPLIRWNTDKTYLRELADKGVPVLDTEWLARGSNIDFCSLLEEKGWAEAVIKPVVSASGKDTYKVSTETWPTIEAEIQALLQTRDLMVQPFMRSVATEGEWSFLFLNGEFSHAVAKRPRAGEFRVQEHLGGIFEALLPTAKQLECAEAVMRQVSWPSLYARVDMMLDEQGQLRLSELEMTEPSMYLAFDEQAPERFAQAILQRLQASPALA